MEFAERLSALAAKVRQQREAIQTEEATKNAFVMPFISTILGYDVFNPLEVVPEFTADVGIKKGEKIDYAIVKDGELQPVRRRSQTEQLIANRRHLPRVDSETFRADLDEIL